MNARRDVLGVDGHIRATSHPGVFEPTSEAES